MSVPNSYGKKMLSDESFQNWLQRKKEEQRIKKENERQLQKIKEEETKIKKEAAALSYEMWKHKKEQQIKGNSIYLLGTF